MRRSYTDDYKATALAVLDASAGNVARAARTLRIPRRTLRCWSEGVNVGPAVPELRHQKRKELAEHLEALVFTLLDAIMEKAADADLKQLAVTFGILVDCMLKQELGCQPGLRR